MSPVFARDVMYGTLDEAPDWQTMVANTGFNESRMDPDWLIHQRPGMSCQSHKDILRKLSLYNLVSVIVSVIFATPYFYEKIGFGKHYAARTSKRLWRTARRRKGDDLSQIVHQDDMNTDISITSSLLSTIGSIIISLAAPCLTGFWLWVKHRANGNLWVIIQQWATRPRAGCFILAINALVVRTKDFKGRPNGFMISALSTMLAEIPLNVLSLGFLSSQIRRHKTQYPHGSPSFNFSLPVEMSFYTNVFDEMQENASALQHMIYIQMCLTGIFAILVIHAAIPCYYVNRGSHEPERDHKENDSERFSRSLFLPWLISLAIYIVSYDLWRDFLTITPDEYYCVEDSVYIDVIYYLLPVVLALWRAIAAIGSKSRSKQKPAVSNRMCEDPSSQDRKDIEQARCDWECLSLMDNRSSEAQSELRRIKRSTTIQHLLAVFHVRSRVV